MLKCYADDSGSHRGEDSNLFVLAGYLLEEERWEQFSEDWDTQLKRDFPVEFFHMTDAESGDGKFEGIASEFRRRKVKDLALLIAGYQPIPIAVSLDKRDYNLIFKGIAPQERDNPYALLLFQLMRGIAEFQKRRKQISGCECEPVEFIFDNQGPEELVTLSWYAGLVDAVPEPFKTIMANTPVFRSDRDFLPLQAADMLAWHVRRDFERPSEKRETLGLITSGAQGQWKGHLDASVLREWAQGSL
ncbi:MAG: DUF3800 domain-containing protein [Terracidiphilus sp.]